MSKKGNRGLLLFDFVMIYYIGYYIMIPSVGKDPNNPDTIAPVGRIYRSAEDIKQTYQRLGETKSALEDMFRRITSLAPNPYGSDNNSSGDESDDHDIQPSSLAAVQPSSLAGPITSRIRQPSQLYGPNGHNDFLQDQRQSSFSTAALAAARRIRDQSKKTGGTKKKNKRMTYKKRKFYKKKSYKKRKCD